MANLSLTAGNVIPDSGYVFRDGVAGETLTQGVLVYLKAADERFWLAHCETSSATADMVGIALNAASAGQAVRVMTAGTITIGATVAVGTLYLLSTSGLIMPHGDIATSDWISFLGSGSTTTKIKLGIHISGVQKAA